MDKTQSYWRSLDDLSGDPEYRKRVEAEFPSAFEELELDGFSRRKFMGVMGASFAMAGLSGCLRKPAEQILPFNQRPEDFVPGKPRFFATSSYEAGQVLGLVVESQDGRPSKIEGNPLHPASRGRANAFAQASVLDLYDPDRSKAPRHKGAAASWADFDAFATEHFKALRAEAGRGLAVVVDAKPSPTRERLLDSLVATMPEARVYTCDAAARSGEARALELAGAGDHQLLLSPSRARVLLAVDSDFLVSEGDSVRNAAEFAEGRRIRSTDDAEKMNRLYAVSSHLTPTSAMADERLRLRASEVGGFMLSLAAALNEAGLNLPDDISQSVGSKAASVGASSFGAWTQAVATDLLAHRGQSLIVVGARQPAWVHTLGHVLNAFLGNVGATLHVVPATAARRRELTELAADAGSTRTVLLLGVNPVGTAPADLDLAAKLGGVETTIHLGLHVDETAAVSTWHVPGTHFLEAWGDLRATDGTAGIQQPLIAPLHPSRSEIELLAAVLGVARPNGYDLVRETWKETGGATFETAWRTWLHDGVIDGTAHGMDAISFEWTEAAASLGAVQYEGPKGAIELEFVLDQKLYDGRFANNSWMQELPDPLTKLTWDNAALMSEATAVSLGLASGKDFSTAAALGHERATVLDVSAGGKSVKAPVFIAPGCADGTVVLALGYGRELGPVSSGAGVNVNSLRTAASPWLTAGASIQPTSEKYKLATTQDHGYMEGRPIVREATVAEFVASPNFAAAAEVLPASKIKSLWIEPNVETGNQWGMAVDLTTCTGCNACVVACGAENNVMTVGKERVLNGREMHWIRIDRYYTGDRDNPQAVMQPVMCQHCELAPCENVCPVAATTHSPEGLNDMAYNRCIGTRYCGDNCPFKVRRFNFFNYSRENDEAAPMFRMQRNPDVTIRFRGVMEKCSYCVQRIQEAKIKAKREGRDRLADGEITPACVQTCPTDALVFGDVNDPDSAVSKLKKLNQNYVMFAELNIAPRTSYLARLRNANRDMV